MPSLTNVLKNCPDANELTGVESFYVIQDGQLRKVTSEILSNSVLKGDKGDPGIGVAGPIGPAGPVNTGGNSIDLSSVVAYPLGFGEVGFLNLNGVTGAVPLNIVSVEGIYEIIISGTATSSSGAGSIALRPNDNNVTAGDIDMMTITSTGTTATGSGATTVTGGQSGTTHTNFQIGKYWTIYSHTFVRTYTQSKGTEVRIISKNAATTYEHGHYINNWIDITTPWTSLGTLYIDTVSHIGVVLVRRVA